MARLIEDAASYKDIQEELGITVDESSMSFANVANAISVVQKRIGIMGATQEEAAHTIEGSVNAMKASWKNLVTGFGDSNADLARLSNEFVDSVVTALGNIGPRVAQVLKGLKDVGIRMAPKLAEGISQAVKSAPEFLRAAMDVLSALGGSLVSQSDVLLDSAFSLLNTLLDGLTDQTDAVVEGMASLLTSLADGLEQNGPTFFDKAVDLINGLIDSLVAHAPEMIIASAQIITNLADGLSSHVVDLLNRVPEIVADLSAAFCSEDNLQLMADAGLALGKALLGSVFSIRHAVIDLMRDLGVPKWLTPKYTEIMDLVKPSEASPSPRPMPRPSRPTPGPSTVPPGYVSAGGFSGGGGSFRRIDGSFASGLDYVPRDGFIAELHRGERVLTADEAHGSGTVINATININGGDFGSRRELAEYLAESLQTLTDRRAAIYG